MCFKTMKVLCARTLMTGVRKLAAISNIVKSATPLHEQTRQTGYFLSEFY